VKFGSDWQSLQLPGAVSESQLASDPRGATTPGNWSTRDGEFVTLLGRHQLNDVELAADLGYRDQLVKANIVDFASGFTQFSESRLHNLVFSPRLRWNASPLGLRSSLVFGTDWGDWNYDRQSIDNSGFMATARASQSSGAFYFQYNTELGDAMKLSLGRREQRIEDRLVQTGFPVSDERQTRNPSAGEVGLQYAISPLWTLFGKVGTSFRVATVDDNAFTATGHLLEPQTARQRELGAEYRKDAVKLRASFYDMYLNNEIYFSPLVTSVGSTFPGANTNLSPTRRTGLELFGSVRTSSDLELSGDAIYQTAKFRYGTYGGVDVSGKDIPLVPRVLANLRTAWLFAPKTQLIAAVSYVGHQRYDNDQDNTFPHLMPAYALADLKISHSTGGWNLSASINNLSDKKYYSYAIRNTAGTTFNAYPQAGRTFFAGAEYAFK
jgi:iron complex outermembrane receptor protein